jgi:hypothetical protein
MKVYISGKITGIEDQAPALFAKAASDVAAMGHEPVNPMTINHDHDQTWQSYMKADVKALCDCDAIYMLSNYKDSKGALIELQIANHLELNVLHQHRRVK